MVADPPLPTLLSQLLVAFTIEFDNDFEQHMPHRTARGPASHARTGPWLVSMAMWSNFMRYIDTDGVALPELEAQVRITNLAGLQRWGYITVEPDPREGPPTPQRRRPMVRPTPAGQRAQQIWQPLASVIEGRWRERFGVRAVSVLRESLAGLVGQFERPLPNYLPVAGVDRHEPISWPEASDDLAWVEPSRADLVALLAKVLLAFDIEYEAASRWSLPLGANVLRLLTDSGVRLRDLPVLSGVSREAVSVSVGFLERHGCAVVGPDPSAARTKLVRLSPRGVEAQDEHHRLVAEVEFGWRARFGDAGVEAVRGAAQDLIGQRADDRSLLAEGLRPYSAGWRANPPYAALTAAVLRDPAAALPHYPMVSHRGGFPDGS